MEGPLPDVDLVIDVLVKADLTPDGITAHELAAARERRRQRRIAEQQQGGGGPPHAGGRLGGRVLPYVSRATTGSGLVFVTCVRSGP